MKTTFTTKYRQNYIGFTWFNGEIKYFFGRRRGRHWRNGTDEPYWLDTLPAIIEHEEMHRALIKYGDSKAHHYIIDILLPDSSCYGLGFDP